ncbi:MAG: tetratricopeptide repeat protein [Capsulimonadaceae bacterium]|nr:tetratricopeptide repeat protein [Capsulimonadaceae bacterium]
MKQDTTLAERLQRALVHKVDGRYSEAVAELRAFLQVYPDDAEAHHQLGLVLGFTGDFDPSLSELHKAVELAPDNTLIRNDLALTYTMLGMYDEAKDQFARVLAKDRENQTALRNLTYFE